MILRGAFKISASSNEEADFDSGKIRSNLTLNSRHFATRVKFFETLAKDQDEISAENKVRLAETLAKDQNEISVENKLLLAEILAKADSRTKAEIFSAATATLATARAGVIATAKDNAKDNAENNAKIDVSKPLLEEPQESISLTIKRDTIQSYYLSAELLENFSQRWFSPKTNEREVEPLIAEYQMKYEEAVNREDFYAARKFKRNMKRDFWVIALKQLFATAISRMQSIK